MAPTYPFWAARLFLLCVSLEVFATPTRRYHGRMLIHHSSPAVPPCWIGVCTHAGSGTLRVRRRLLVACLGDTIHLATTGTLPLGLRVLDAFLSSCCMKEFGDEFGCVIWKLQLSPLEHCSLDFHCQQSPRILSTLFCPWILDHGVSFIISISGARILISFLLLDTSFYRCLQSVIIRSSFLLMNLQVVQFQYGLEFLRLSYS